MGRVYGEYLVGETFKVGDASITLILKPFSVDLVDNGVTNQTVNMRMYYVLG